MNRTSPPQLGGESRRSRSLGVLAEPEQAGLGRDQGLLQLIRPAGMSEIAGADDGDPLAERPPGQMLDVAVPATGAGESGVDVQVGVKHAVVVRSPVIGCLDRSDTATRRTDSRWRRLRRTARHLVCRRERCLSNCRAAAARGPVSAGRPVRSAPNVRRSRYPAGRAGPGRPAPGRRRPAAPWTAAAAAGLCDTNAGERRPGVPAASDMAACALAPQIAADRTVQIGRRAMLKDLTVLTPPLRRVRGIPHRGRRLPAARDGRSRRPPDRMRLSIFPMTARFLSARQEQRRVLMRMREDPIDGGRSRADYGELLSTSGLPLSTLTMWNHDHESRYR